MKYLTAVLHDGNAGHSPHGECGLKFIRSKIQISQAGVTPRMGSAG